MPKNECLDQAWIETRIQTRFIGHPVVYLPVVDSTNAWLKRRSETGQVAEGTVVVAEEQTGGEGRHGRKWHSPASLGLWFSVLLEGKTVTTRTHLLPMAAGVASVLGIRQTTGLTPELRWPNDIYWQGLKLGGILGRNLSKQEKTILGIGINVNQKETDFFPELRERAVSLRQISGRTVHRESLFVNLLVEFERQVIWLKSGDADSVLMRYVQFSQLTDRTVRLKLGDDQVDGKVVGYTSSGALVLETPGGGREHFFEGEVKEVVDAVGH